VTKDELVVDTTLGTKLRINFEVEFPDMACAVVNLDAANAGDFIFFVCESCVVQNLLNTLVMDL
jgi:hypothetical protein